MLRAHLISSVSILCLAGMLLFSPMAFASETPQILAFSKTAGYRHGSISDALAALAKLGDDHGFTVVATEDADDFNQANLANFAAVVFVMTSGDVLNATQQSAFEEYIRAGGGYVGIHSASDTEYDWPWYGQLLGAFFDRHPAQQTATLTVEDATHPSTSDLPGTFQRFDEWYDFQSNPRDQVNILITIDESTYSGGGMGEDHPIAWYHNFDGGRSWYTAMGHTSDSYTEALILSHLLGGIQYAAGLGAEDQPVIYSDGFEKPDTSP